MFHYIIIIAVALPIRMITNSPAFKMEQIIFSSGHNITKLLVKADDHKYIQAESSDIPSIFFTIADNRLKGGSCIYVLEGLAAFEVLEGGRDSTADYSHDRKIYFGANDGIYIYDSETLSARRFGSFQDDIVQIQKANGIDEIYALNSERELYKFEKNCTVKTRMQQIVCALEFVLDTSNNVYYIACEDHLPHILLSGGNLSLTSSPISHFKVITLLRPAFVMEGCIPFFGDGNLYFLYSNGTSEKKDFSIKETPSAFSVDAALYLVAAYNGKIYEFNVMDVLLRSMFGISSGLPNDATRIVMSLIENA